MKYVIMFESKFQEYTTVFINNNKFKFFKTNISFSFFIFARKKIKIVLY